MTPAESHGFFQGLAAMGLMFCDEITEMRQKLYWQLLHEQCTLAEWEYACTQAMCRETFYKVPLPSPLLDYVREYRAEQKRSEEAATAYAEQEKSRIANEKRLALEASPAWQAEQAEKVRQREEEYNTWLASLSYEDKILYRIINPPRDGSQPFRRLTDDELQYTPTVDAQTSRQKARAQLQKLLEQTPGKEG